jgi:antitoxin YefM
MGTITIQEIYDKLVFIEKHMVTKEELEPIMDSIEILSNPATMQALAKSDEDIRNGKIKKISDVNDLLAELDYS